MLDQMVGNFGHDLSVHYKMDFNATLGNSVLELDDGMEFESHEAAYSYYREYAKSMGFGTAKLSSRRSRASREFIDAKFSCIRYGSKQQSDDAINPRPSPKIGCKASMHVKRRQNGKWYVYSFVKEHNHELLPGQAHFFRSHRDIDPLKNDLRVRKRKMSSSVCKQFGVYQNIECLDTYLRNQHDRGRKLALEAGDAQLLLDHFMHMQEENPKFFYAVDLNEEHRLRNVFWVDSKGIDDYANFGDVVYFDTTYFRNKFKIPLVLFVGVNHHIQPTLLGCALVADETIYTFAWLMQTWRVSMGDQAPRLMLSDQNNCIKAAIAAVFPETRHCLCLWHVLEKIPKQFDFLSPWHDGFMAKFNKCIYSSWSVELFDKRWWKLVDRFGLQENEWFQSLYDDRTQWVPTFMRDVCFAGLSTGSRPESLNSSFDKCVHGVTSMREFIEQYRTILEDRYEEEAKANFDAWHETPEIKSPSPFEKQVSLVYTHEIFKKFQIEVLGAAACHLKKENEDGRTILYSVTDLESDKKFMVEWDDLKSDIYCSCRLFEYEGYLCRHAIFVLQMSGIFYIPIKYILQRWTNIATSRHAIHERLDEVQSKIRRYNDLCQRAIILGEEGSLSQESYSVALCSIREALKRCEEVNNPVENDLRLSTSAVDAVCTIEEENRPSHTASREKGSESSTSCVRNASLRIEAGMEKIINDHNTNQKGKATAGPMLVGSIIPTQGSFQPMALSSMRPTQLHDIQPAHTMATLPLHHVVPTVFHNVPSAQFRNLASALMPEKRFPL